jgi:hypothetical protein
MTLSVMILLGVGLSAICGVMARRAIASAFRQSATLPPAQLIFTLVSIYSGWALIRWLATLDVSGTLDGNLFTYSAVAYAVCQLDVALFVVSRVEGQARSKLRVLWFPLQGKRFRTWVATLLVGAALTNSIVPMAFQAPVIRWLGSISALVGGICVFWDAAYPTEAGSRSSRSGRVL